MEKSLYDSIDPLKKDYYEAIIEQPERFDSIRKKNLALLCIDMQYLDAARGWGVFIDPLKSGVPTEAQEYYFRTLEMITLKKVRQLQDAFRRHGLEIIHIRIQSLTRDGRDRSPGHKMLKLHAPPGSKEAEFLEEVAPQEDEIIINKTASGVFNSTNLLYVLKNLEVDSLYVTGVYTNECVETTVRDASDLGFYVTLISDGCTTVTPELQDYSIKVLKDRYARVLNADEAIQEMERLIEKSPA